MRMSDLISAASILPALKASSKKQVLQEMCATAALNCGLPEREILYTITQRERVGSTGAGNGVAIPHGKFAKLNRIVGVFARLEKPVDYDSPDGAPVDLVFMLLAPEGAGADHLKALSRVARLLRDPDVTAKLRATKDTDGLYVLMTQDAKPFAA
ncbi:PTS IIA-like nitrogen regulatory protein PtsN [Methylocella sp. CPCC 101449]|uniref:PTS IIA-like nitrogen regulatory protein PtsN n=1 Tax=Methylocella sp. CPCC 101449 TaxID=2987531 RepID=UPI00288F27C7|nr:PTS IIA-like nitrogen regulatory protein PtsN [Methylocella sp. CPCC 101449]MDT2019801.1 PTS IIA-like nitrogen regulatory protein PtsN [Methylocella sp. CPCC 101449]